MIGAVEVLDALRVNLTELLREVIFVLIFKVKAGLSQHGVFLNDLVKDVDVERKALCTLKVLDKLAADRAPNTILVVKLRDTIGAERVATMD